MRSSEVPIKYKKKIRNKYYFSIKLNARDILMPSSFVLYCFLIDNGITA